ncbi:MAG TPA: Abi family protein [Paludibacter sp.]|nr:Abi family protein [Paludibacter sp.]
MKFTKPALSVDDQVALLRQRGMGFPDEVAARHVLNYVNYYRLRAYWLPFEVGSAANATAAHAFMPGTQFETVLTSYTFDQRLKLLLMDAMERVEIALRTPLGARTRVAL